MAARIHLQMAGWRPSPPADRRLKEAIGHIAPTYTMVDLTRLRQLARLATRVHEAGIQGSIVECGTWRGGGLALIDWVLRQHGENRTLWGLDSFQGLPRPDDRDGSHVQSSYFDGWCSASQDDVKRAIETLGGDVSRVRLVPGWLAETLPRAQTGTIALLNIDVDWYSSVKTTLDLLFDRVAPGGIVNVDDYGRWPGCDEAVHDFMREQGLPAHSLHRTGRVGAWLQKR